MNLATRTLFLVAASALAVPAQTTTILPPNDSPQGEKLVAAAEAGNLNEVKTLLAQGVPIDATDKDGESALFISAQKRPDVAFYLLGKGAKVNITANDRSTPLLNAVFGNDTRVVLALLDAGADPNICSKFNFYPLMDAAGLGNDEVVAALLAHHAKVDVANREGSALCCAVWAGHLSTVKRLLQAGADVNLQATGNTIKTDFYFPLLGQAASRHEEPMVNLLLDNNAEVQVPSFDGCTALMGAAYGDNPHDMQRFLDAGAQIDAENNDGATALVIAARCSKPETVKFLVDHGANMNLADQLGRTPLMQACLSGSDPNARMLVQAGADAGLADRNGDTAMTYASSTGQPALVDFLRAHGAGEDGIHLLHPPPHPPEAHTPSQAWALAVGALYVQKDGADPTVLGNGRTVDEARAVLKSWNIHNQAQLLHEVDDLTTLGNRAAFIKDGARFAGMSAADFAAEIAKHLDRADRDTACRKLYPKWHERTGLAFDLCRAAMLVNCGYALHLLKKDEAWKRLEAIARQLQASFHSWQEVSDNFLDGREIWTGKRDPGYEMCAKLLLDPKEPLSPWNQNAWQTSLAAGK